MSSPWQIDASVKKLPGYKAIARAFYEMQARMNDSILDTLRDVAITENGIDFEEAGLKTPAATWTYIINDNPLGNWSQRLRSSVKRMVQKKWNAR